MTTWRDDEETILDSDIWAVAKNIAPYSSPEEELEAWHETVRVLEHLCGMAGALALDPLTLALVDAKYRAEDERERAVDRARRSGGELTQREEDTLTRLRQRADAFSNAWVLYEEHSLEHPQREKELEILNEMRLDADEQYRRYRQECGLTSREASGPGLR